MRAELQARQRVLKDLAPVIGACTERLRGVLERASATLSKEEAEQLQSASRRSIDAMNELEATLAGERHAGNAASQPEACARIPTLGEEAARHILNELNDMIGDIEHNVLVPAERDLSGTELAHLRRLVGRAWGWIVWDLQDPLWQQHPQMGPSSG